MIRIVLAGLALALWSAALAHNLHVSYQRHLPIGRALLAGAIVGLAVVGLLTLVVTLWFLIFGQDNLRRKELSDPVTAHNTSVAS
jgi:Na+/H+-translocating membrane pyrophosphatase